MIKKIGYLAIAGFAVLTLATAFVATYRAHADNNGGDDSDHGAGQIQEMQDEDHGGIVGQAAHENEDESGSRSTQESVSLRPNGDFAVTGAKVNSVDASSTSVNVTFYGFTRTVSLSGAVIMGGRRTISISDIQPGDILSGSGNYNKTTRTISVSRVVDVSFADRNTLNIQAQIDRLLELVQQLQEQLHAMESR